jgi:hypothetical protein
MNFTRTLALLLGLSIFCSTSYAANIRYETRDIDKNFSNRDFLGTWKSMTNDIRSTTLDSFTNIKSGNKRLSLLTIDFELTQNDNWSIEAGLDAGYGAAIYVNDEKVGESLSDLWWKHKWNNKSVFSVDNLDLIAGLNTIQALWAENCCNGSSSIRFSNNSTEMVLLTTENLAAAEQTNQNLAAAKLRTQNLIVASVPEPSTLAIFALGIMGLVSRRLKKYP